MYDNVREPPAAGSGSCVLFMSALDGTDGDAFDKIALQEGI